MTPRRTHEGAELRAAWAAEHGARRGTAHPCAHSLAGRLHIPRPDGLDLCRPPGLDHAETWTLPGRRRVLVHHPYTPPDATLVRIFDAWWGTTTTVHPPASSWYWPGQTWRVEVWPA